MSTDHTNVHGYTSCASQRSSDDQGRNIGSRSADQGANLEQGDRAHVEPFGIELSIDFSPVDQLAFPLLPVKSMWHYQIRFVLTAPSKKETDSQGS